MELDPYDFSHWSQLFGGHILKVCASVELPLIPKGKAIPLPWPFVHYLNEDGIFVGEDNKAFVKYKNQESSSSEDERWKETQNDAETEEQEKSFEFPELSSQVQAVIAEYENVFPKFNTRAPVDASWMNWCGKNKCSHPDQVFS